MVSEKIKNYQKPVVATVVGSFAMLPMQSAITHHQVDMSPGDVSSHIIAEQHLPHRVGHHFNDYYIDPRSIRAIGQDSGKSDERSRSGRENWDLYIKRNY